MVGSPGSLPARVTRARVTRRSRGLMMTWSLVTGVDTGEDEESL